MLRELKVGEICDDCTFESPRAGSGRIGDGRDGSRVFYNSGVFCQFKFEILLLLSGSGII